MFGGRAVTFYSVNYQFRNSNACSKIFLKRQQTAHAVIYDSIARQKKKTTTTTKGKFFFSFFFFGSAQLKDLHRSIAHSKHLHLFREEMDMYTLKHSLEKANIYVGIFSYFPLRETEGERALPHCFRLIASQVAIRAILREREEKKHRKYPRLNIDK